MPFFAGPAHAWEALPVSAQAPPSFFPAALRGLHCPPARSITIVSIPVGILSWWMDFETEVLSHTCMHHAGFIVLGVHAC